MDTKAIKITIYPTNAAFGEEDCQQTEEVIQVLKRAIKQLEESQSICQRFNLRDRNGNQVGQFTYSYY